MQFIPSTWSVVGVDGDGDGKRNPQDIDDAALATAVYLCSGNEDLSTTAGQRSAVYRYNHSHDYVDLVLSIMQAYAGGDFSSVPTSSAGTTTFTPDYGDSVFASGTSGYAPGDSDLAAAAPGTAAARRRPAAAARASGGTPAPRAHASRAPAASRPPAAAARAPARATATKVTDPVKKTSPKPSPPPPTPTPAAPATKAKATRCAADARRQDSRAWQPDQLLRRRRLTPACAASRPASPPALSG